MPQLELALLDALPLGILITNPDGTIRYSNRAFQTLFAFPPYRLLGRHWLDVIHSGDRVELLAQWQDCAANDEGVAVEARLISFSGKSLWTRHRIAAAGSDLNSDSDFDSLESCRIHTIEDIRALKSAERAKRAALESLQKECARARVTLECIGDAVISTDTDGRVTYLNSVAEALTGWSREAACGQPFDEVFRVISSVTGEAADNPAAQAMKSRAIVQLAANSCLVRSDGSELAIEDSAAPILNDAGRVSGAVVVFRDRRLSQDSTARMAHLARHDALTGLPNRVALADHVEQAIRLAARHGKRVGLLFLDLDHFKQVNDRLGHKAGDRVLEELARTLESCVRSTDLVCRLGGDEFVILLSEIGRAEDAGKVSDKIHAALAPSRDLDGHTLSLTLSIGISLYPQDGKALDRLLNCADLAMYHATLDSTQSQCFYRSGMERSSISVNAQNVINVSRRSDSERLPPG